MLQIDGYTAPDKEIALSQGVTFDYPTQYGDITVTTKLAGRDNVKWRLAMKVHNEWLDRRRNLDTSDDKEAERRFLSIVHDHLVLSWSTTIKSGGQEIEPTKENFIALMTAPATSKVINVFLQDAADEKHFRPLSDEEMEGNSDTPSDG